MDKNIMDKKTLKKKILKSIDKIINEYISKICEYDGMDKTFEEKLQNISILTDNLIDYCIKKKIFYFIENKIGYTNIVCNFKSHLAKFIKDLVDPNDSIISKYIINTSDDNISMGKMGWDNVSDINSIMFKNFKNLNESFEKNVSFGTDIKTNTFDNDSIGITNYDEVSNDFGFELNRDICRLDEIKNKDPYTKENELSDNVSQNQLIINNINVDSKILPIYIKLLINQNKYLVELTDKLISMCKILSESDIKYKKNNPYN